jgi:hypothetical protein
VSPLILKRASASRPSRQWSDDDYDVLRTAPSWGASSSCRSRQRAAPWMWASGHSADSVGRAAHGYEPTREAAMAAFANSCATGVKRATVGTGRGCPCRPPCLLT